MARSSTAPPAIDTPPMAFAPRGREAAVDGGGEFGRQVRLPLVPAENRVVGIPVGVHAVLAADRHYHVDVLVGEEVPHTGVVEPGDPVRPAADSGEQVEGGRRST